MANSTLRTFFLYSALLIATAMAPSSLANDGKDPWFEGQHAVLKSPDGRYRLVNEDCPDAPKSLFPEGLHILFLEGATGFKSKDGVRKYSLEGAKFCAINPVKEQLDHLNQQVRKHSSARSLGILAYQGRVSVLWSPDSKYIAINENVGSNMTFARLLTASNPEVQVDFNDKLRRLFKKSNEWQGVDTWDHRYINVSKWLNPTRLELILTGHGDDPKGTFTLVFYYDVSGTIKFVKKLNNEIAGHW